MFQEYYDEVRAAKTSPAYRPLPPYPPSVLEAFEAQHAPFVFPPDLRLYLTTISREYPLPSLARGTSYGTYVDARGILTGVRAIVPLYFTDTSMPRRRSRVVLPEGVTGLSASPQYTDTEDVYSVTHPILDAERAFAETVFDHPGVLRAADTIRRVSVAFALLPKDALEFWRVWAERHPELVHVEDVAYLLPLPPLLETPEYDYDENEYECRFCTAPWSLTKPEMSYDDALAEHVGAVKRSKYADAIDKMEADMYLTSSTDDVDPVVVVVVPATTKDSHYITIHSDEYGMGLKLCVSSDNPACLGTFIDSTCIGGSSFTYFMPSFTAVHLSDNQFRA